MYFSDNLIIWKIIYCHTLKEILCFNIIKIKNYDCDKYTSNYGIKDNLKEIYIYNTRKNETKLLMVLDALFSNYNLLVTDNELYREVYWVCLARILLLKALQYSLPNF